MNLRASRKIAPIVLLLILCVPIIALAVAYDVSTGTIGDDSFDVGDQTSGPRAISFADDGGRLFVGDWDGDIFTYTLSTPYDLTTATYDDATIDLPQIGSSGLDEMVVSNDGTKLLALEFYDRRIYEYTMSTPYDITTATYTTNNLFISEGLNNYGFGVKPDGTKIYVASDYNSKIFQYSLSSAWDVSTASYDSVSVNIPNFSDGQILGMYISQNGENVYLTSATNERIHWMTLSTP